MAVDKELEDIAEDTTPSLDDQLYATNAAGTTDKQVSLQNLLELGASVNLVDRGDVSAYDFGSGDLTQDGSWYDMDLSSIVPTGATWVLLKVALDDASAGTVVLFRKNGNTGTHVPGVLRQQVANQYTDAQMLIPLDASRIIEYNISEAVSDVGVLVIGWLTDTSSMVALGYSDKLVDRGDPSAWDYTQSDFTTDGTWRDLDLSDIIPAGATHVLLRIQIKDDAIGSTIWLRKNGYSNIYNSPSVRTQVLNTPIEAELLVSCDSARVIEYQGSNLTFTDINVVVLGWVEGSSDYPAMNFVDRGDVSASDFDEGDLTTDLTWNDLDLSDIVPAGATWVYLRVQLMDDATDSNLGFRKNGASGEWQATSVRTQVVNQYIFGFLWVPLDSNRVIEYKGSNVAFTNIDIVVLGWAIDNSTYAPLKDLVDRGDVATWDWEVGDFTTDDTWRDLDCSDIVPAGATYIYIKIELTDDLAEKYFGFRKNGTTGAANPQYVFTQVSTVVTSAFLMIPCDANRVIEYRGENVAFTKASVVILGWVMGSTSEALPYAPNDIINPEFAIAQEGATITAASTPANNDDTYVLDQWILLSDGNDIADITRASAAPPTGSKYNIKVEIETASKKVGIFQPIENQNSLKYTSEYASLSFWLKGDVDNIRVAILSWDSTADTITSDIISAWNAEGSDPTMVANWTIENVPANIAPTGSWVEHKIEGILIDTSGMTNLGVFFWLDDTDAAVDEYFEIGKVKLEQNLVCTKFMPNTVEDEYERCLRYCWFLENVSGYVYHRFIAGICTSSVLCDCSVILPVPMRLESPAITQSGIAVWDENITALTAIEIKSQGKTQVQVRGTVASGLTTYRPAHLLSNNVNTAYIKFDARL